MSEDQFAEYPVVLERIHIETVPEGRSGSNANAAMFLQD
jgi:hypothetical protein